VAFSFCGYFWAIFDRDGGDSGRFTQFHRAVELLRWVHPYYLPGKIECAEDSMYCDQCGAQLQSGEVRCPRCGKTILGLVDPRRSRVREHVRLLAILWMAYSALHVFVGVGALVVARVIFGHALHIQNGPPPEVTVWLRPLISLVGWLILAKAAVGFLTGWGLLRYEEWARIVALVLGFIALLSVPLGTALGIYTLWVLLPRQSDEEYRALSQAA
jgi:hypothetical protein